jgi:O-6-methylguanine DNA methyltransferase
MAVAQHRHRLPDGFVIVRGETPFQRRVLETVRRIPPGRVASYGEIARWAGRPGAARAVGTTLARSAGDAPAHRVVTSTGRLVPGWEIGQAELLRAEGVRISDGHVPPPQPWWEGPGAARRQAISR